MNPDFLISEFLKMVGINLPAMIAMVIGMVWVKMTWHRHPRAARWAMLAFVWIFTTYLLTISWHTFGLFLLVGNNQIQQQTPYLLTLSCFEALGYLFFMMALNAARTPYRPPQYYDNFGDDDDPPRK